MSNSIKNRNTAFSEIIGELSEKRKYIFQFIQANPNHTTQSIAEQLLLPINEVTGRITELKDACLIIESGSNTNSYTRKQNTTYIVVDDMDQRTDLINKRFVYYRDIIDKLENDSNLGISTLSKSIIKREILKYNRKINQLGEIDADL